MTSPPCLSRSQQLRLILPGVFALLIIPALAGLSAWQTWRCLEVYYLVKNNPGIDAEVISVDKYKTNLSGFVKFRLYDGDIYKDCIENVDFGGESNYLKFKLGNAIKIIPRANCDNPIVIAAVRFPILYLIMSIIYTSFAFVLVKNILRAFR